MATINQRILTYYKRQKKNKRPKLNFGPHKRGVVLRLRICTPRKPNSARRPAVKLNLSTKKKALAHIPGQKHNLRRYSKVLISGGGARDLPVVNYTCIRGILDFSPQFNKRKRRSIYGVKKNSESIIYKIKIHIKRKLKKIYSIC